MSPLDAPHARPGGTRRYQSTTAEVDHLISSAREHPLGLEFLEQGALDAVAATFRTHAFVVEAARERLGRPEGEPG